ncbi:MAG: OmpA family protein [candidate division Zixibacteria bacterium]|nr:OmpA family protein [candidate division Zixibacteria bacterium]
MKIRLMLSLLIVALMAGGCGVNKTYVASEIAASEARTAAELDQVRDKTDLNATEITRLQGLATALDEKADLAINKASGFENYQIIWSGKISYDFDDYNINGVAASILDEAGMKLEEVPHSLIEIVGHTDQTGSAKYNIMLGEKRANAAKRYLADKFGTSLYRMFIVSYGEEKPVALPDERNASSQNRRVTLTIWGSIQ